AAPEGLSDSSLLGTGEHGGGYRSRTTPRGPAVPRLDYSTRGSGGRRASGARGSSMVIVVWARSGPVRYRACSLAIAVAVQAQDASRTHPQEHVMRQRGPGDVSGG